MPSSRRRLLYHRGKAHASNWGAETNRRTEDRENRRTTEEPQIRGTEEQTSILELWLCSGQSIGKQRKSPPIVLLLGEFGLLVPSPATRRLESSPASRVSRLLPREPLPSSKQNQHVIGTSEPHDSWLPPKSPSAAIGSQLLALPSCPATRDKAAYCKREGFCSLF